MAPTRRTRKNAIGTAINVIPAISSARRSLRRVRFGAGADEVTVVMPALADGCPGVRARLWPGLAAELLVDGRLRRVDDRSRIVTLRFDLRGHRVVEGVVDPAEPRDEAPRAGIGRTFDEDLLAGSGRDVL